MKNEIIGETDRGIYSETLSDEALKVVQPSYTSENIDSLHSNCDIDHKALLRVALGERFYLNGNLVNATYDNWLGNLLILVNAGYINLCMREAFIERNQFNREKTSTTNTKNVEADLPLYFYPHWTI
jgi:hypothetical protein